MNPTARSATAPDAGHLHLAQQLGARHAHWAAWTWIYLAMAAVSLILMAVDERLLQGVSVWMKPFKFQLSIAVYFATLAWFAPLLRDGFFATWRGRLMTFLAAFWAAAEIAYITFQGAVGEASHFNFTTEFHRTAFSIMGFGATCLVAVCLWMAAEILIQTRGTRRSAYLWAVIAGLTLTFALGGGFGGYLGNAGGHWVDAPATDAGGLWLFGWTRQGGDLRAAHFFGMHAMQVLPLVGWLAGRWLTRPAALGAVAVAAAGYAVLSTAVFLQALAGHPFPG